MPRGRPTKYTPDLLKKAWKYLEKWNKNGDVIPTDAALCGHIKITLETFYTWRKEKGKEEFSDIALEIDRIQKRLLINNGLIGTFTSKVASIMLSNHGIIERKEQEITLKSRRFNLNFNNFNKDDDDA